MWSYTLAGEAGKAAQGLDRAQLSIFTLIPELPPNFWEGHLVFPCLFLIFSAENWIFLGVNISSSHSPFRVIPLQTIGNFAIV